MKGKEKLPSVGEEAGGLNLYHKTIIYFGGRRRRNWCRYIKLSVSLFLFHYLVLCSFTGKMSKVMNYKEGYCFWGTGSRLPDIVGCGLEGIA